MNKEMEEFKIALAESLKLQSHYAKMLNVYDSGERLTFETVESWIERLRECGTLLPDPAEPISLEEYKKQYPEEFVRP